MVRERLEGKVSSNLSVKGDEGAVQWWVLSVAILASQSPFNTGSSTLHTLHGTLDELPWRILDTVNDSLRIVDEDALNIENISLAIAINVLECRHLPAASDRVPILVDSATLKILVGEQRELPNVHPFHLGNLLASLLQNPVACSNLSPTPVNGIDLLPKQPEETSLVLRPLVSWHDVIVRHSRSLCIPTGGLRRLPGRRRRSSAFTLRRCLGRCSLQLDGSLHEGDFCLLELLARIAAAIVDVGELLEVTVDPYLLDTPRKVFKERTESVLGEIALGDAGDQDSLGLNRVGVFLLSEVLLTCDKEVLHFFANDVQDVNWTPPLEPRVLVTQREKYVQVKTQTQARWAQ